MSIYARVDHNGDPEWPIRVIDIDGNRSFISIEEAEELVDNLMEVIVAAKRAAARKDS